MLIKRLLPFLLVALVLVGCNPPQPSLSLTVTTANLEVRPGKPTEVGVSVTRNNFTGPITVKPSVPSELAVADLTIPEWASSGTLSVTTTETTDEKNLEMNLVASAVGVAETSTKVNVAVVLGEINVGSSGSLTLDSGSASGFNAPNTPISFKLVGAEISNPVQVYARVNNQQVDPAQIQVSPNGVVLNRPLEDGRNAILVTLGTKDKKTVVGSAELWSGSNQLTVAVVDAQGQAVSAADVEMRLADDPSITAKGVTTNGSVLFPNIPNRTVAIRAFKITQNAFKAVVGGNRTETLALTDIKAPSAIDNNDFTKGLEGWEVGAAPATLIPHVEGPIGSPRNASNLTTNLNPQPRARIEAAQSPSVLRQTTGDLDLQVGTSGEGLQSVSRTFTVPDGTQSVKVRYRFITSEVPGGYFGSQYNDYFNISIRSSSGGVISAGNSMNGLGLAAFDTAGATNWYVGTLTLAATGGTVQVDAGVANVADAALQSQVVVDGVFADNIKITADKEEACPNETITFTAESKSTAPITWSGASDPTTGTGITFKARFNDMGSKQIRAEQVDGSNTIKGEKTVTINELSGAAWVARYPTSTSTADLTGAFQGNANSFIAALQAAGATVNISATYRPAKRAFLMHYSYKVAKGLITPESVPALDGVKICWAHRKANGDLDLAASKTAAQAMVSAYGIVYAPALQSRHTEGTAVDMTISWSGTLTINNAAGTAVQITTTPRGGGNTDLHTIGAGYGVIKLVSDPPHWSGDGS